MKWQLNLESLVGAIDRAEGRGEQVPATFTPLALAIIAERLDAIATSLDRAERLGWGPDGGGH